ncbi:radical SAM protein [Telmatobacter bradus]|uniref:radical SAM protein n=1 Tax=Telmatobacter bradus TaxID=474953 RepID=UPI003B42FBB7
MLKRRHSSEYNFVGDTETGITMRWGRTPEEDPVFAPWPELADIFISNHCSAGCTFCYRDSRADNSFMALEDYERVLDALTSPRWGSVFQVALGGGEPLEHPDFLKILEATTRRGIIANFTTNGQHVTREVAQSIAGLVGAVAISTSNLDHLDRNKIDYLVSAGIRTNLHYILDRNSIFQAIDILHGAYRELLADVNAVIFLTYKPRGRADASLCLEDGPELRAFLASVSNNNAGVHIGFDACFVPLLLHDTDTEAQYVDACECAFFSIYIDEKLNVKPCSFATEGKDAWNLRHHSMEKIWKESFSAYRAGLLDQMCSADCKAAQRFHGSCAYFDQLNFCHSGPVCAR